MPVFCHPAADSGTRDPLSVHSTLHLLNSANGNILPEHNDRMTKSGDFRLGQTCRLSEMTHTSSDVQHCTTSLRSWNVSMWNQTVNLNSFLFGTTTVGVATAARLNTNPSTNRQVQSKAGPQLTATWPSLLLYWRASWYSQGFRV